MKDKRMKGAGVAVTAAVALSMVGLTGCAATQSAAALKATVVGDFGFHGYVAADSSFDVSHKARKLDALGLADLAGIHGGRFETAGLVAHMDFSQVDDAVHQAGLKAKSDRETAEAEKALAAKRAELEAAAAADEAALEGGEVVEDENAPEGTMAVKSESGEVRYVSEHKVQKAVDSGKTAPKGGSKKSESKSGSGSKDSDSKGSSDSSASETEKPSSNSGNSGSGDSGSKKPAAEEKPAHVHNWKTRTWQDEPTVEKIYGHYTVCFECDYQEKTEDMTYCHNCGGTMLAGVGGYETVTHPGATHTETYCDCGATK